MYIGLNLTFASSFQMFRGAVIIFVALLSVAFLQRRLVAREWTGIFIIVIGLAMVCRFLSIFCIQRLIKYFYLFIENNFSI